MSDHDALVRVLRERVMSATGVLEDGSTDTKNGPLQFTTASGGKQPLRNLAEEYVQKMQKAIARIDAARAQGLGISANMYTYTAGATGLDAAMPPWVQEGGIDAWVARLQKPEIRARVIKEMKEPAKDWESLLLAAGSPDRCAPPPRPSPARP